MVVGSFILLTVYCLFLLTAEPQTEDEGRRRDFSGHEGTKKNEDHDGILRTGSCLG